MSNNPRIINNSRRRALAEKIIDLTDRLSMFESVKIYVNKDCLVSPDLGDSHAESKKTKTGVRYAITEAPGYAKNLMSQRQKAQHIILITYDGHLYDSLKNNPEFRTTFETYLKQTTDEYDCHYQFISPSRLAIYPNDENLAKPFAKGGEAV